MSYRKILSAGAPSNDAMQLGADGEAIYLPAESLAAAGSSASDAGEITDAVVNVTAADGTKGVVLPAALAGRIFYVYNAVATNGLKIYPDGTETINGGTGGAAVTIEGKTLATFVCPADGNWAASFTANS